MKKQLLILLSTAGMVLGSSQASEVFRGSDGSTWLYDATYKVIDKSYRFDDASDLTAVCNHLGFRAGITSLRSESDTELTVRIGEDGKFGGFIDPSHPRPSHPLDITICDESDVRPPVPSQEYEKIETDRGVTSILNPRMNGFGIRGGVEACRHYGFSKYLQQAEKTFSDLPGTVRFDSSGRILNIDRCQGSCMVVSVLFCGD